MDITILLWSQPMASRIPSKWQPKRIVAESFQATVPSPGRFASESETEQTSNEVVQKNFSGFKTACCTAGALIFAASLVSAETVWLSSLDLTRMTCGWSVSKANLGIAGTTLSVGGKQFPHGVGTHAESRLR